MAAASTEHRERSALYATVIEGTVRVQAEDVAAAASVRANWGWVAVKVTEPLEAAGVTLEHDRRGFIFALGCRVDPTRRFTDGRALTAAGRQKAQKLLRCMIEHHHVVRTHPEPIARLWLRVTERIAELERRKAQVADPQERRALRQRFRRGEMDQALYQQRRKQLVIRDRQRGWRHDALVHRARTGFTRRTGRLYGRELEHSLVGQLVRLAVVREQLPGALRKRIETISGEADAA